MRPDPRFAFRQDDVPAASHPPLAAAMARLAGPMEGESIWDPFCGSGLELIERTLRGGVRHVFGTDRNAEAIAITRENFAAAVKNPPASTFACTDFRDHSAIAGLKDLSLIITNPPMGRRVPIPNLPGLIADLLASASAVLRPGGRLVFANPLPVEPRGDSLKLDSRRKVDLGGFHVHLEKYQKR
jgi:tRNA G10  N-methylase Trm11